MVQLKIPSSVARKNREINPWAVGVQTNSPALGHLLTFSNRLVVSSDLFLQVTSSLIEFMKGQDLLIFQYNMNDRESSQKQSDVTEVSPNSKGGTSANRTLADSFASVLSVRLQVAQGKLALSYQDIVSMGPAMHLGMLVYLFESTGSRTFFDTFSFLATLSRECSQRVSGKETVIASAWNSTDRSTDNKIYGSKGIIQWSGRYFSGQYSSSLKLPKEVTDSVYSILEYLPIWLQFLMTEVYYKEAISIVRPPKTKGESTWNPKTRPSYKGLRIIDAYYYSTMIPQYHVIRSQVDYKFSAWGRRDFLSFQSEVMKWMEPITSRAMLASPIDILMRGAWTYDMSIINGVLTSYLLKQMTDLVPEVDQLSTMFETLSSERALARRDEDKKLAMRQAYTASMLYKIVLE